MASLLDCDILPFSVFWPVFEFIFTLFFSKLAIVFCKSCLASIPSFAALNIIIQSTCTGSDQHTHTHIISPVSNKLIYAVYAFVDLTITF